MKPPLQAAQSSAATGGEDNGPDRPGGEDAAYLQAVGAAVRAARARSGITRKALAAQSGISERFLAQLETGTGNASILVLRQVAEALQLPVASLLGGAIADGPELARSIQMLRRLPPAALRKARETLARQFGGGDQGRRDRIALIGLRGAGKSSVGAALARRLERPFFELDRLIEESSGISLNMIFDMYGQSGFRRLERRCLDELLEKQSRFVLATGGGLVSEPANYERLLSACYTVWLEASPEEHMSRVMAQGDMRPMAKNPEAMADLQRILAEREHLYRQADLTVRTSGHSVAQIAGQIAETTTTAHRHP